MCENYLILVHQDDILRILEDPEKNKYFSVSINFLELFESDTNLGNSLLTDPENSLKNWDEAVFNVQNNLIKEVDKKYTIKNNVNCRIYSLPPWPHVCRTIFPGNDDANKFLQVTGTVIRMSARKLLEYQRQYVCTKCKFPITVEAIYDKRNIIKQPKKCNNPEGCTGKNIITFGELDPCNCKDYQEIKIQEDLSKMSVGTIPGHMVVTLEDDLVNVCKPGENVTITGIVKRRWSEFEKGVKITVDIVLKANHIQVNNSSGLSIAVSDDMRQFFDGFWTKYRHDPLVGRNIILKSISPEIYGRQLVKLAMAIVLAGGSPNKESQHSTGIDTRSESHLLLVGDPGTGKSQMLRFASKIVPRSVLTTGVGSTAAGLTVTAIMENGEWQLEAGALIMADGGICCIDEFNSMREHDRTSIHEAMEQQTISVAKAGIVCKLKTRCSILAACNPKGNIDRSQPLCVNVAMSSPLLSRFDLILLLRDIVNEENDRKLADYVLLNEGCELTRDPVIWNVEKLQAYYAIIKKESPKLTSESETILSTYYQLQRKFGSRNKSRTTVRLLESLIRLSQGHAKLMYHSEVEVIDTIFPIILMDTALDYESALLNLNIDNDSFFDNPEPMYWELLENILGKLNLDYIYQQEVEKMRMNTIKKSSQNTSIGVSQRTSPNLKEHGTVQQNTPKRTALLFSQRAPSQQEHEQNDINNSPLANKCERIDVQNTNINKSQLLFSQKRPENKQNHTDNIQVSQNGPKLLFSQKRLRQQVSENSVTARNRYEFSQRIRDDNQVYDKNNTVTKDTNSNQFSIYQNPNDSFIRDRVVLNLNKESSSQQIKGVKKQDHFRKDALLKSSEEITKSKTVDSNKDNLDKEKMTLSQIVNSTKLDFDSYFTNLEMPIASDNKAEHSKCDPSFNKTDEEEESGFCSQIITDNENGNLKRSILEEPANNLTIAKKTPLTSEKKLRKQDKTTTNDIGLLSFMPSIHDDFMNFGLNIDWDMNEPHERISSQVNTFKGNINSDTIDDENKFNEHTKNAEEMKQFVSRERKENEEINTGEKNRNDIEENVKDKEGMKHHENVENNEADLINSSRTASPKPIKKFKFQNKTITNKYPSILTDTKPDDN